MSLISAMGKLILKKGSDAITKSASKRAQQKAFNNTGKKMRSVRRKKTRSDWQKTYRRELGKEMKKVNENAEDRLFFISHL